MNQYIIQFLTGGVTTALVSYILNMFDNNLATIIWSWPVTLFTILLINKPNNISDVLIKSTITCFLTILLLIVIVLLINNKLIKKNKNAFLYSLILGTIIWFIIAYFIYKLDLLNKIVNSINFYK